MNSLLLSAATLGVNLLGAPGVKEPGSGCSAAPTPRRSGPAAFGAGVLAALALIAARRRRG